MSYDLVFWRGRPTETPSTVWRKLNAGQAVAFMLPLVFEEVVAGFREEYGEDLRIEGSGELQGRGWSFGIDDGALYLYVTCAWALAEDPAALARLRSAGRRAGCSMYDPQTGQYFEASARLEPRTRAVVANTGESSEVELRPGERVDHASFGAGEVVAVEGRGATAKVRVRFAVGVKTLLARVLTPGHARDTR